MDFLADENFPLKSIQLLVQHGHRVRTVFELFRGETDSRILTEAVEKEEVIVTFDKDFGELIFKQNQSSPPAVILFRLQHFLPEEPGSIILNTIQNSTFSFTGMLTVISQNNIRQKKLPGKL